ncbi:MAG: hypothetical protein AW09_002713 [Candidatus Accumulibacter phosphatis]|uniref:Uncharacterized protein n=1 Tax=Candidatus Accumulibacter phosphatis TaxID=327160 RepID=A0A080LUC6_9PROT|nr:MAG: hypothetical protein AW09_002713 [Candidatus Accumulibacter phosphatis]
MRPEQNRQQQPAAEMATRTGAGDAEVDHLGSKKEGAENAHQRHLALVEFVRDLFRAIGNGAR